MMQFKQSYEVVQNFINGLDREEIFILATIHNLNLANLHSNTEYKEGNIAELYRLRNEKIVKVIRILDEIVILTDMLGDEEEA